MMWQSNKWANISMGYKVINHFDTHETLRDHPTVLATGYHSPAISRKRTHELWTYNHHVTMVTRSTEKFRHLKWLYLSTPLILHPFSTSSRLCLQPLELQVASWENEEVRVTPVSNHDLPCIWVLKIRCIPKILLLMGENEVLHHGFIRGFPFNFQPQNLHGDVDNKKP